MDEHFLVSFLVLRIDTFKEKCCSPDSKIKKKIVGDHENAKYWKHEIILWKIIYIILIQLQNTFKQPS